MPKVSKKFTGKMPFTSVETNSETSNYFKQSATSRETFETWKNIPNVSVGAPLPVESVCSALDNINFTENFDDSIDMICELLEDECAEIPLMGADKNNVNQRIQEVVSMCGQSSKEIKKLPFLDEKGQFMVPASHRTIAYYLQMSISEENVEELTESCGKTELDCQSDIKKRTQTSPSSDGPCPSTGFKFRVGQSSFHWPASGNPCKEALSGLECDCCKPSKPVEIVPDHGEKEDRIGSNTEDRWKYYIWYLRQSLKNSPGSQFKTTASELKA